LSEDQIRFQSVRCQHAVPPTYAVVLKLLGIGNIDSSVSLQTPVDLRL